VHHDTHASFPVLAGELDTTSTASRFGLAADAILESSPLPDLIESRQLCCLIFVEKSCCGGVASARFGTVSNSIPVADFGMCADTRDGGANRRRLSKRSFLT